MLVIGGGGVMVVIGGGGGGGNVRAVLGIRFNCSYYYIPWNTTLQIMSDDHSLRITDMSEYSKPCSLCVLPFASAANPIIFNGNMFFTKPKNMTVKQMGLWVVLLFGIGLSFGLELQ